MLPQSSENCNALHPLKDHIANFQAYNRSRNLSARTIEKYGSHLDIFHSWLATLYPPDAAITLQIIRQFVVSRLDKGDRPATVRSFTQVLKTFFNFLVAEGVIAEQDNPVRLLKNPKVPMPQIAPLTADETVKLLSSFDKGKPNEYRDFVACLLILDTGLRVGEVSRLKLSDLDLDKCRIRVTGKGGKFRFAYFGQRMNAVLHEYLNNTRQHLPSRWKGNNSAPLFPVLSNNRLGEAIRRRHLTEVVRQKMDQVGISRCNSSAHRLRHTFATNFLRNQGGLLQLQKLLGHSSLTMTKRYIMFNEDDLAEAHRKASPLDHPGT